MKKMNRKGFTLIELLAVIVVLAIILVITVPMILNTLGDTRQSAFQSSANSTAKWFENQYALNQIDKSKTDGAYKNWVIGKDLTNDNKLTSELFKSLGLNETDYSLDSTVRFNSNGKVCVILRPGTSSNSKFNTVPLTKSSSCDSFY